MRIALAFSVVVVLPMTACLAPTNPFDPELPSDLQAPAQVSGSVVDASGTALDGARVTLTEQDGSVVEQAVTAGAFSFTDVTPGSIVVEVTHPAFFIKAVPFFLFAGDKRDVVIEMTALPLGGDQVGHAAGTILLEAELARDEAVRDHSGASIEVEGADVVETTSKDGSYDLFLLPGTYNLIVSARGHLTQRIDGVEVVVGNVVDVPALTLPINPGSVSGVVTLEDVTPGVETHGDVVVSAAGVSVTTSDDDAFTLTNLPSGAVQIRYSRADYVTETQTVIVEAGAEVQAEPVTLRRVSRSVTGTVTLVGGADNAGALVTLSGNGVSLAATSAADGSFTISNVPTGTYTVEARKDGFTNDDAIVEVTAAGTIAPVVLTLIAQIGDFEINNGAQFTNDPLVTIEIESDTAATMRVSEDPDFSDAFTPVAFDPQFDFTLSSGDGVKTIFVELIDANGVPSGPFTATITLDETPPVILDAAINGGAQFSNNTDGLVTLTITATDVTSGVDTMQISLDDAVFDEAPQQFVNAVVVPLLPNEDRLHTIFVSLTDRAGNAVDAADVVSRSITLDRVEPVVGSLVIEDAQTQRTDFARSSAVTLSINTASTDVASMMVSTDPLFPVEVLEPFAARRAFFLEPGEGTKTAAVKLVDFAGNESNALADTIDVDSVGPQGAFVLVNAGAAVTNTRTVPLTLFADDIFEVRVSTDGVFDDEGYSTTIPANVTFASGDGTKTVFAQFRDEAGNESLVVTDSIELDETGPVLDADASLTGDTIVISFDGTATGEAFTSSVAVNVSFDVDGADEMAIAVDGDVNTEAFEPFSSVATVLLPSGDCAANNRECKRVCAVFRDVAGNATTEVCDAIGLDTTPPAAPLFVESASVIKTAAFTAHLVEKTEDTFFDHYEVFVSPSGNGFVDATPGTPANGEIPFALTLTAPTSTDPALAAQSNLIRMIAVDEAGNVSPESTLSVIVDPIAPPAPVLAGLPSPINADTVSLNFAVGQNLADDDATFDHYVIETTLLPEPVDSFQRDGIIVTLLPDTINIFDVRAVDRAGNVSGPAVTVDPQCPLDAGVRLPCVREDSRAPSAPTITPSAGVVRARNVEMYLVTPSIDSFTGVNGPVSEALLAYDLRDGSGVGFTAQPAGSGPFNAAVRANRVNQVCLRGRDNARNESDQDCANIEDATRSTVVDTADEPRLIDLSGDFLVYSKGGDVGVLRDLRGHLDDIELSTFALRDNLSMAGDAAFMNISFDTDGGNVALHVVDVDDSNGTILFTPDRFQGFQSSIGSAALNVGGFEVVFAVPGAQANTVRLRRRPAALPLQGAVDVFGADVTLCTNTGPRVSRGVVVWCEEQAGNRVIRRTIPGVAGAQTISRAGAIIPNEINGALTQNPLAAVQPVISEFFIAWAEQTATGARLVMLDDPLDTTPNAIELDVSVDRISDISGAIVALNQRNDTGITNDVAIVNLGTGELAQITDDLPPQDNVVVDGTHVAFQDTAQGETVELVDTSVQRWLSGSLELSFDPATSANATSWIETRGNFLRLLARRIPFDGTPIVEVDAPPAPPIAFAGPSHEDPRHAVGGTVVAYLSNGSAGFDLNVREIVTGAFAVVATNIQGPIAMDPDGDAVVYVDGLDRIVRTGLTINNGAIGLSTTIVEQTNDVVLFVDVDDNLIVWQEGSNNQGDASAGSLRCEDTANGVAQTIDLGGTGGSTLGRGPKVAKRGNVAALAYLEQGVRATVCLLSCVPPPNNCAPRFAAGANVNGSSQQQRVSIARDGTVAYLTDELGGANQVVLFDIDTRRRTFLTNDTFDHDGLSLAEGRAVWADPSLGTFDIWEHTR
jgi:hypothetical protein